MPKQRSLVERLAEKEEEIRILKLKENINKLKEQLPRRRKRRKLTG